MKLQELSNWATLFLSIIAMLVCIYFNWSADNLMAEAEYWSGRSARNMVRTKEIYRRIDKVRNHMAEICG